MVALNTHTQPKPIAVLLLYFALSALYKFKSVSLFCLSHTLLAGANVCWFDHLVRVSCMIDVVNSG